VGFLRFKERVTKARSLSMDNFGAEFISVVFRMTEKLNGKNWKKRRAWLQRTILPILCSTQIRAILHSNPELRRRALKTRRNCKARLLGISNSGISETRSRKRPVPIMR
jgi:hypothetical protein